MSLPSLPEVPRERRRTATVVVVAALGSACLLGLVVGLRGLLADPHPTVRPLPAVAGATTGVPTPLVAVPSTASTATTVAPAAPSAARGVLLRSPSGNISCHLTAALARCDVRHRSWHLPAAPAGCAHAWGRGVQVAATTAELVCADDVVTGGAVLPYGRRQAQGAFSCTSSAAGVRCQGPGGHGFVVARASYSLF